MSIENNDVPYIQVNELEGDENILKFDNDTFFSNAVDARSDMNTNKLISDGIASFNQLVDPLAHIKKFDRGEVDIPENHVDVFIGQKGEELNKLLNAYISNDKISKESIVTALAELNNMEGLIKELEEFKSNTPEQIELARLEKIQKEKEYERSRSFIQAVAGNGAIARASRGRGAENIK